MVRRYEGIALACLFAVLAAGLAFGNDHSDRFAVESCGEPNAFYASDSRTLVMCEEFVPHLYDIAEQIMG